MQRFPPSDNATGPMKSTPRWYHGAFTGTGCSSGFMLESLPLTFWQSSHFATYMDFCIIWLVIKISCLTNCWQSFTTPFHVNLSNTLAKVFRKPRCPDVGATWHALKIRCCSSLFLMYLTCISTVCNVM